MFIAQNHFRSSIESDATDKLLDAFSSKSLHLGVEARLQMALDCIAELNTIHLRHHDIGKNQIHLIL